MYLNPAERPFARAAQPAAAPQQRMDSLKELIQLEQTRINIADSLNAVLERIHVLQNDLLQSSQSSQSQFRTDLDSPLKLAQQFGKSSLKRRMRRGELRGRILDFLREAGTNGARVREIADALGVKPVNVHSWFHTATQRFPQLKRFGPGRYRLETDLPDSELSSTEIPKPRRNRSTKQASRGKRGEVSKRILEVLENADPEGIKVAEIAEKVGAKYRNVHVWLSSIGKRNPRIIRSGRGIYRMKRADHTQEALAKSKN
jgi:predicted transcriptional regulator with HTH domain